MEKIMNNRDIFRYIKINKILAEDNFLSFLWKYLLKSHKPLSAKAFKSRPKL